MRILFFLLLSLGIAHAVIVIDTKGLGATAARRYLERHIEQTTQNLASTQNGIHVREADHPIGNIHTQSFSEVMPVIGGNPSQQTSSTLAENASHEEKHTLSDVAILLSELDAQLDISSAALQQSLECEAEIKKIQDQLEENARLLIKSRRSWQSAERIDEIERRRDQLYANLGSAISSLTSSRSTLQDDTEFQDIDTRTTDTDPKKFEFTKSGYFYPDITGDFVLSPEQSVPHNFLPIRQTDINGNPLTENLPSSSLNSRDSFDETADEAATQNEFPQKKPV